MMMVLVLHINQCGGFLKIDSNDFYEFCIDLYEHLSIIAVDVFVIISAWFLRLKSASFSKVLNLIWIILFWTVVMSSLAVLLGEPLTLADIVNSIPVIGRAYGFCSGYIIMYLCSPFLNKMLDNMSLKQISLMAISIFVLFSLFSQLSRNNYMSIGGGYSFMWFIMLYIITAWIKIIQCWLPSKWVFLTLYLLGSIIGTISEYYDIPVLGSLYYNNPLVVISAFCLFLFFVKTEIRSNVLIFLIRYLAPLSFGVFLIHANPILVRWYQQYQFSNWLDEIILLYTIGIPLFVIVVYLICSLLEYLRERLFMVLKVKERTAGSCNKLDVNVTNRINGIRKNIPEKKVYSGNPQS